jgi:hypothetical protein
MLYVYLTWSNVRFIIRKPWVKICGTSSGDISTEVKQVNIQKPKRKKKEKEKKFCIWWLEVQNSHMEPKTI